MPLRIAVESDIHGNRTAFETVLKNLREISPDLLLHGGDLADVDRGPAEMVDQIRDLGWPGVLANTNEAHTRTESLEELARAVFGAHPPKPPAFSDEPLRTPPPLSLRSRPGFPSQGSYRPRAVPTARSVVRHSSDRR